MERKFNSKKQLENAIREQITSSSNQAIKAMLRIYEYQTVDEQVYGDVTSQNGVGFVITDSEILTSLSKQYLKNGRLSEKQVASIFKKIGKYAGQLLRQAIDRGLYVKEGKVWMVANTANKEE